MQHKTLNFTPGQHVHILNIAFQLLAKVEGETLARKSLQKMYLLYRRSLPQQDSLLVVLKAIPACVGFSFSHLGTFSLTFKNKI